MAFMDTGTGQTILKKYHNFSLRTRLSHHSHEHRKHIYVVSSMDGLTDGQNRSIDTVHTYVGRIKRKNNKALIFKFHFFITAG